jgi:3-oxoacyl-[acyl-carrier protein] reductase
MKETKELAGKVAIVTGGSRGIGRAIVSRLAAAGCAVAFTYQNQAEAAESLVKSIEQGRALALKADVRDFNVAQSVVERTRETFSRVDILINNAGITRDGALSRMSETDWHDVVDTNLTGCFNYTRSVTPLLMRQSSGRIINISSISGVYGLAGQANYSATKAGMLGFTKALSKELGPFNITVNAIAPGYIETEMLDHLLPAFKTKMQQRTSLRRFGQPEEVAEVAFFLASERAGYMTGQVLEVDGGIS